MDFQESMAKYAKYGISVKTSKNNGVEYYMVSLELGTRWKVQENDNGCVRCAKISKNGTYCYITEVSNGIMPIFEEIDDTIRYNEEMEKKVELLKVKAEELKRLFEETGYDDLLFLKYVIDKPNQDAPKQRAKKQSKPSAKRQVSAYPEPIAEHDEAKAEEREMATVASVSDIDSKIAAAMGK